MEASSLNKVLHCGRYPEYFEHVIASINPVTPDGFYWLVLNQTVHDVGTCHPASEEPLLGAPSQYISIFLRVGLPTLPRLSLTQTPVQSSVALRHYVCRAHPSVICNVRTLS